MTKTERKWVGRIQQPHPETGVEVCTLTIAELAHIFMRRYQGLRSRRPSTRTLKEYHNHLENFVIPQWGDCLVDAVPVFTIIMALQDKAEVSPVQANRIQATLSVMFSWAHKNGLMRSNPILGYDKAGGREDSKTRALDFDNRLNEAVDIGEIRQFWFGLDGINPKLKYSLRMILLTGQRPGEVLNARRDDFLVQGSSRWIIPRTKNRKGVHKLPITPMLQALLDELNGLTGDCDWLFPDARGRRPITNSALAQRVRKELANESSPLFGMEVWTPHDLRRTVATHLGVLGYLDSSIGMLLNHSGKGITAVYNLSDPFEHVRTMLESWQRHLQDILDK
jgi:integrase